MYNWFWFELMRKVLFYFAIWCGILSVNWLLINPYWRFEIGFIPRIIVFNRFLLSYWILNYISYSMGSNVYNILVSIFVYLFIYLFFTGFCNNKYYSIKLRKEPIIFIRKILIFHRRLFCYILNRWEVSYNK